MTTFEEWLNEIPEYREYRAARDAELAAMSPERRAAVESAAAASVDMALYGETFFTEDGKHVPRNEARGFGGGEQ